MPEARTYTHYTTAQKRAVLDLVRRGVTATEAGRRSGVAKSAAVKWAREAGLGGLTTYRHGARTIRARAPWSTIHRVVRLYLDGDLPCRAVAERTGVPLHNVNTWLDGLDLRRPRYLAVRLHYGPAADEAEAVRLYGRPFLHTQREIAIILGRSSHWVHLVLRRRGIVCPPTQERRRQRGTLGKTRHALRLPASLARQPSTSDG